MARAKRFGRALGNPAVLPFPRVLGPIFDYILCRVEMLVLTAEDAAPPGPITTRCRDRRFLIAGLHDGRILRLLY